MREKSIKREIKISGKTLHKGEFSNLVIKPLKEGSGIIFKKDNVEIPVSPNSVVDTRMATTIGKEGIVIHTIEHIMSAIYSLGISNLLIEIDSNEPPILDGSGIEFLKILETGEIIEQNKDRKTLIIEKEISIIDENRSVSISPNREGKFSINSKIDFKHKAIGYQDFSLNIDLESYRKEIAGARTFGFLKDFEMLKSNNLALGATMDNVIVLGDDEVLNKDGLRFENEFVRHKILDVIGDLSLLGMNIEGSYKSFASSHNLNYRLIQKILSDERNYSVKS
jgi:UDP-3-O-[3-hydroxymyristoyl] N-acetylglucosamine deacetylase